jgi:hypothetical protein
MAAYGRHHFVPQFYLRNFAIDDRQRQIALYNVTSEIFVRATSIRNQAQRHKLYGADANEKALSDLEGAASTILKRMINRKEVPKWHSGDHFTLLVYVLFQAQRTPTAAEELRESAEQFVKMIASFESELAPHVNDIKLEMPDAVSHALQLAALHHPIAMDLRYKLLINRTSMPFVTSDHPVVLYNQFMERRRKVGSASGLACKGLQILFPLSPECYLILFDYAVYKVGGRSTTGVQVPVTAADVSSLNLLQAVNAGDQLFFNSRISEQAARALMNAAASCRRGARSSIKAYPEQVQTDGTSSVLLHSSKTDLRIGLKLSNVEELKSARDYRLGSKIVHQRDPVLCDLHDQFIKKVDAKLYRVSEFGKFIEDEQQKAAAHDLKY